MDEIEKFQAKMPDAMMSLSGTKYYRGHPIQVSYQVTLTGTIDKRTSDIDRIKREFQQALNAVEEDLLPIHAAQ